MKRINLLPQEERVKAARERGLIWAILILVAVVVVLGLVYVKYNSDVSAKQDQLASIKAEQATVDAKIAELSPYAALQAQRTAMTETAKGIYQSSVPFSILLQELSLVIPENVRLATLTATVPPAMLPGAAAVAGTAPADGSTSTDVTFTGQTENHRDVAEFMTRLGLIPQLMSITLTSSTEAAATSSTTTASSPPTVTYTSFTVTAALRPYATQPPTTTLQTGVTP
jgi:Tfp pilus assembly protein PilN